MLPSGHCNSSRPGLLRPQAVNRLSISSCPNTHQNSAQTLSIAGCSPVQHLYRAQQGLIHRKRPSCAASNRSESATDTTEFMTQTPHHPALTTYVIAGVSCSGKSTVGKLLAERLGSQFFDGDDFHTDAAKEKMRSGHPLTDEDRMPWLATLAVAIQKNASSDKPTVFACSALKRKYREVLAARAEAGDPARLLFVVLNPPRDVLQARLEQRWKCGGHFMPPTLLDSQLADLEVDPTPPLSSTAHADTPAVEGQADAAPMFVLREALSPEEQVERILQHSAVLAFVEQSMEQPS